MSTMAASKIGLPTVEDDERHASQILIRVIGIALILALTWAALFELDEITVGQGKVIPTSREQIIQSLDSGVLSELLVREGSVVDKGDVLLRIDSARSGAVYREAREKYLGLLALSSRLKAEAYSMPLRFPEEIANEKDLIRQETQAYEARRRALQESVRALDISISATMRELALTTPMVEKASCPRWSCCACVVSNPS